MLSSLRDSVIESQNVPEANAFTYHLRSFLTQEYIAFH